MSAKFNRNIRPFVEAELTLARVARISGHYTNEFMHLENAHVLGQPVTFLHVKVHCLMLMWAVRQKNPHEIFGQLFRIIGAATKTGIGLVPRGNTGGANISPFKALPLKPSHAAIITSARKQL